MKKLIIGFIAMISVLGFNFAEEGYRWELDPFNCEEVGIMPLAKVKNDFDLLTTYISCNMDEVSISLMVGKRANFPGNTERERYVREFLTTIEFKSNMRWYAIREREVKKTKALFKKDADRKAKADYIKARYGSNK